MLSKKKALKAHNEGKNQDIKSDLVSREVYCCMSYEMEAMLKANAVHGIKDLPSWDDIDNAYNELCQECGSDDIIDGICQECKSDNVDNEPAEIFEWWRVSEFLYKKLKEYNQCTLEFGCGYYWGRCTSGQAILLDYVIGKIASDMEILEGQKYSWGKKQ